MSAKNQGPVMGGHGAMRGGVSVNGARAKNFKSTFGKLMQYLSKFRVAICVVFLFAILSTVFNILGPSILGNATTELFNGVMAMITGTGGIRFDVIMQILLFLLALYLVSALFSYIQGFIMSGISMKVTYRLRDDISQKINRLPLKYFDKTSYGEVLSHITNDVDTVSQTLNQSLTQIITSVTTLIGILVMMFTISWQMTLIALCILPVSLLVVLQIVKRSQKFFQRQQKYLGNVNGHVEEMYGGHVVIKAFNHETQSIEKFEEENDKLYKTAWKSQFLSGMMMPAMNFIGNLGYVGICILGGYLATLGRITVGNIQAFIQYVRQFTQPINQIANISNILQQTMAAAERVFEFLEEEEESPDTTTPVKPEGIEGQVSFEHVRFGYDEDKIIIKDFSVDVRPGQKIAIVGPTGAGKTTLVKLLMRFYDLNGGSIKIDGHDITDFTRDDLRSMFAMVLQETWLYHDTIRNNIRYGKLDATDEEVYEAAKSAQAHRFIKTLPEGYDMVVNEEANNISQGQKQLLTIARAILADPKILILDEATSSVDTRTEILIQKAMDHLMEGRTSFVIAHRLSTIRDADCILVLNEGDVVEQGTHEELLKKGGFYAKLYNSQFEQVE